MNEMTGAQTWCMEGGLATQAKHLKSKPLVGILLRCCEDADKNEQSAHGWDNRGIHKKD